MARLSLAFIVGAVAVPRWNIVYCPYKILRAILANSPETIIIIHIWNNKSFPANAHVCGTNVHNKILSVKRRI